MNRAAGVLLSMCMGVVAVAQTPAPTKPPLTEGGSTVAALSELERAWAAAITNGDSAQLARILGEDWIEISNDGKKLTKDQLVAGVKSGRVKVDSIQLGPLDVKVLGDVAVVQGSHVEKTMANGQATRGEVVWMDVFARRNGNWVVVRSQSAARVEVATRPRWPI